MPSAQRQLIVGLVQINRALNLSRQRFKGRRQPGGSVGSAAAPATEADRWQLFPYSVGMLQAYAQAHASSPTAFRFLAPIHVPLAIDDAVARLEGADVVGFSVYVWNVELSLAIARRLKAVRPATLIVFGGPQVPDRAETFLRQNPAVDLACHGQGETTFLAILEQAANVDGEAADWDRVPGVSFLDADRRFHHQPQGPRLTDLSTIPSPYLSGVFDPLIAEHARSKWIMMWETNRGCPFACTFCDWGSAVASKVFQFDRERLKAELEWFARLGGETVFCCDANFGILPRDVDLARDAIETKQRYGLPRTLAVQNTKNATERAYTVQKMLADAGMNAGVTISMQSTDARTLKAVKRDNISLGSFLELQRRYTRDRIETYSDMILALPEETFDSFANGISEVIANGQHNRIQFYNCSLLPNAEMNDPAQRACYGLESVAQRMVDMHGPVQALQDSPAEHLEVVVATGAMPAADWVRAKAYSWMTDLLYFDRLLHIPFVLAQAWWRLRYRELVDAMIAADPVRFPVVAELYAGLVGHARGIQQGGIEYIPSPEWLDLCWPADQHALIQLTTSFKTDDFYQEAGQILAELLNRRAPGADPAPLLEAVDVNRQMFRLPFEIDDLEIELQHNILEAYHGALISERVPLRQARFHVQISRTRPIWLSWDDWFEHLIFCQNQKATYLYPALMVHEPSEEMVSYA
jgi:radical SAM superfamily enzyme YgiQ (UPF0313 family)